jgi:polysaccharide pyruvyl transferase CsaB
MPKIAISGYYGFSNCGDEAILAGIVEAFRRRLSGVELVVLSGDPGSTSRAFGVTGVPRWPLGAVKAVLKDCDLLISGGGGLLQDTTSRWSLRYYLAVLQAAIELGSKTMVFAQGIGPIARWGSERALRSVLNRVDMITVRDPTSAELLESLGIRAQRRLSADAAFLLPQAAAPIDRGARDGTVCVCVRRSRGGRRAVRELAFGLDTLCRESGRRIEFLPLQRDDVEASERVLSRMSQGARVVEHTDFAGVIDTIGSAELVVGMRLHALIFATMRCVPFVAVSYDPKVRAFAEDVGVSACLDIDWLDAQALAAEAVGALQSAEEVQGRLMAARTRLTDRARVSLELAASLLGR